MAWLVLPDSFRGLGAWSYSMESLETQQMDHTERSKAGLRIVSPVTSLGGVEGV